MADAELLDRAFHRIMRELVETGRAPHYAELARVLALPVDEGRETLLAVMQAYSIGWLHRDYLSAWYPKRAAERRAVLERIGKTTAFWLGTPAPS